MPIKPRIAAFERDMTAWRRDIHAHPELCFEERRTAAVVADLLRRFGCDAVATGIAETGVVGVIHGRGGPNGRSIGLRADMDGLPVPEANDFAHASRHPGKMHACGHDGHTAMLLGAARYLAETRDFAGTVNVIFQPAEEGGGGARRMIEEGLFDRFPCDAVYGLHNWPESPAGEIAVRAGAMMAATDQFTITLKGRGGHAAMPHLGVDPVLAGANLVVALQSLVSRNTAPTEAAVLSVTMFHAGTASNVIPPTAQLDGTVRTLSAADRDRMEEGLRRMVHSVAGGFGAEATVDYRRGYPVTVNTAAEADRAAHAAAGVVGVGKVRRDFAPSMAAEDFGYMLEQKPGAYVWLGQGGSGLGCSLHNPRYDFNDEMLSVGASFWAELAENELPLSS
jgi:amidohydrolase